MITNRYQWPPPIRVPYHDGQRQKTSEFIAVVLTLVFCTIIRVAIRHRHAPTSR